MTMGSTLAASAEPAVASSAAALSIAELRMVKNSWFDYDARSNANGVSLMERSWVPRVRDGKGVTERDFLAEEATIAV